LLNRASYRRDELLQLGPALRLYHVVPETSRLPFCFDEFAKASPPICRIGVGALFDDCRECLIGFANVAFLYLEFLLFQSQNSWYRTSRLLRRRNSLRGGAEGSAEKQATGNNADAVRA
jgi:hypothetical protein